MNRGCNETTGFSELLQRFEQNILILDSWYNKRLSVAKKVEVVTNKINEIDIKQQLQNVRKLLTECIVDIEDGGCLL